MKRMAVIALAGALALAGCSSDGDGGGDASVSFGGIEDGATVTSPVSVDFETSGFEIVAADAGGDGETSGHMHVMVDTGCVTTGEVIPSDDSHIHYGDGSTSAELELEPGEYDLCLQAGDAGHEASDLTDQVSITVE